MGQDKGVTVENCRDLEPEMFIVDHGAGEQPDERIQRLKSPLDGDGLHCWFLAKEKATALHYHDYDEYWAWMKGRSVVTIRLPDGRSGKFEVGPGQVVHCVRGVEHGHEPLEDWGCYEWRSVIEPDARKGHLKREI